MARFAALLSAAESPPQWMAEYARSFCAGDSVTVAARLDESLDINEEDVREVFAKREWTCDRIRYLGSSAGQRGMAYVFVTEDRAAHIESWWVFTISKTGKVVRID